MSGMVYLRDAARAAHVATAASGGDLARCRDLARGLLDTPSMSRSDDAIRDLGFAALLAFDADAVCAGLQAVEGTGHALRRRWRAGPRWRRRGRRRVPRYA